MGRLTTHVLDTARGLPGSGITVTLYRNLGEQYALIRDAVTNADGRCDEPLLEGTAFAPGRYRLSLNRTGYLANDAHTAWLKMGSPKDLDASQLQRLQDMTRDEPELVREMRVPRSGRLSLRVNMRTHDVVQLRLEKVVA